MLNNPELRRNIWLDFSLHRLILTPVTISLLAYLCYLGTPHMSASLCFYSAMLFMFIWGPRLAADTVIEEVNNNTWDFQRQSAISPWSMTLGKWLGSTLYSWYGALISLAIYVLVHLHADLPKTQLTSEITLMIIGGLFTQALALLLSLQILPLVRHDHSNKTFSYFFVAVVSGAILTTHAISAVTSGGIVSWHHVLFNKSQFYPLSMLGFLAWVIIGLYRSFSKELQYQNIPWVWLLFNLYCIGYFSGFTSVFDNFNANVFAKMPDLRTALRASPYYLSYMVITVLCYFALFTDSLNSIRYRRLLSRLTENNLNEALQQLPWWVVSFLLTIIVGLFSAITPQEFVGDFKQFSPPIFILTSTLFLARDILIVNYFYLSRNPRRAVGAAVLYLALLWIAIPMLFQAMHAAYLLPLLIPSWGKDVLLCIVAVLVQIGLMALLCWNRWQRTWKDLDSPPTQLAKVN